VISADDVLGRAARRQPDADRAIVGSGEHPLTARVEGRGGDPAPVAAQRARNRDRGSGSPSQQAMPGRRQMSTVAVTGRLAASSGNSIRTDPVGLPWDRCLTPSAELTTWAHVTTCRSPTSAPSPDGRPSGLRNRTVNASGPVSAMPGTPPRPHAYLHITDWQVMGVMPTPR
jgi:hypothetical protein